MQFTAEIRTNGLAYITVTDDGRPAGTFTMSAEDWTKFKKSLAKTFTVEEAPQ